MPVNEANLTIFGGVLFASSLERVSVVQGCCQGMGTQQEAGGNAATGSEILLSVSTVKSTELCDKVRGRLRAVGPDYRGVCFRHAYLGVTMRWHSVARICLHFECQIVAEKGYDRGVRVR